MREIIPETQIACLNEIEISCFPLDLWCSIDGHDSQLCTDGVKVGIKPKGLLVSSTVFMIVFFILFQLSNTIFMISFHIIITMPATIVFTFIIDLFSTSLAFIIRRNLTMV